MRTLQELQAFLNRFKFCGMMSHLNCDLEVSFIPNVSTPSDCLVTALCTIPDRDTNNPRVFEPVFRVSLRWTDDELRTQITQWLFRVWVHEFYESIQFDNQRIKEQH